MAAAIQVVPDLRAAGPEHIHSRLDARGLRHTLVHSGRRKGDIFLDPFITHAEPGAGSSIGMIAHKTRNPAIAPPERTSLAQYRGKYAWILQGGMRASQATQAETADEISFAADGRLH